MLFVILGINLQQSFAQNDSVVLPDYMSSTKYPRLNPNYLKTHWDLIYDESKGKNVSVTYFTIGDKKPVRVNNLVSYKNNRCEDFYMNYPIRNSIIASFCVNENECIIIIQTLEIYKFNYIDSSLILISDLYDTGLFTNDINYSYNKIINEIDVKIRENNTSCLNLYCKYKGIENINIGRMGSGNLVKVDSTWFLSFQYLPLSRDINDGVDILLKSNDLKNWTKCKVILNYKYKNYNESLKTFVPFLFTFENVDGHLRNIYKKENDLYFSDNNHVIYKSIDGGNTFKLHKIFRPFPEPVVPTFENTNH